MILAQIEHWYVNKGRDAPLFAYRSLRKVDEISRPMLKIDEEFFFSKHKFWFSTLVDARTMVESSQQITTITKTPEEQKPNKTFPLLLIFSFFLFAC